MASRVWFLRFSRRMPSSSSVDLAVDADAEALLVEGFELFAELALAAADDGGEDGDALAEGARLRLRSTIWATIWSADWREMGRWQLGQWGWPTEA